MGKGEGGTSYEMSDQYLAVPVHGFILVITIDHPWFISRSTDVLQ